MTKHQGTALMIGRKVALSVAALLFLSASLFAEEPTCKSKGGEVRVSYPELARRMKISGVVRLHLQLTPSGSVRDAKVLGGNPVLASAAQDAVKRAKFEGTESCIATFEFKE
jgi:TonB family protein